MKINRLLGGLVLAAAAAAAQAVDWTKIRIGVEGAYPPFSQIDTSGNLSGFDIDIANALCAKMKAECTFVQQEWTGMIPALNSGKFDAIIAAMAITEERKKAVDFSDKYYNVPSRWIARVGSTLVFTPEGLKGKRVGVLRGSGRDKALTDQYKLTEVVRYGKETDAYLDLKAGRVDTVLTSAVVGSLAFVKKPEGKGFALYGTPLYLDQGSAVAVRKADPDLRDKFSTAIKAIRADGTYNKIAVKYFDFDIYGQ